MPSVRKLQLTKDKTAVVSDLIQSLLQEGIVVIGAKISGEDVELEFETDISKDLSNVKKIVQTAFPEHKIKEKE